MLLFHHWMLFQSLLFSASGLLASPGRVARRKDYRFIQKLAPNFRPRTLPPVHIYAPRNATEYTTHTNSVGGLFGMFNVVTTPETKLSRIVDTNQLSDALKRHPKGILVLPGGETRNYKSALFKRPKLVPEELKKAVMSGWIVLGVCAGAYIAMERFFLKGKSHEGLGLVKGHATVGTVGNGKDPVALDVTLNDGDEEGAVATVFFEGPIVSASDPHTDVLATFVGGELDGKPAVVSVKCGKGRVILSTVHVESMFLRCFEWAEHYTGQVSQFGENLNSLQIDPDEGCYVFYNEYDNDQGLACSICPVENMIYNLQLVEKILGEMGDAGNQE